MPSSTGPPGAPTTLLQTGGGSGSGSGASRSGLHHDYDPMHLQMISIDRRECLELDLERLREQADRIHQAVLRRACAPSNATNSTSSNTPNSTSNSKQQLNTVLIHYERVRASLEEEIANLERQLEQEYAQGGSSGQHSQYAAYSQQHHHGSKDLYPNTNATAHQQKFPTGSSSKTNSSTTAPPTSQNPVHHSHDVVMEQAAHQPVSTSSNYLAQPSTLLTSMATGSGAATVGKSSSSGGTSSSSLGNVAGASSTTGAGGSKFSMHGTSSNSSSSTLGSRRIGAGNSGHGSYANSHLLQPSSTSLHHTSSHSSNNSGTASREQSSGLSHPNTSTTLHRLGSERRTGYSPHKHYSNYSTGSRNTPAHNSPLRHGYSTSTSGSNYKSSSTSRGHQYSKSSNSGTASSGLHTTSSTNSTSPHFESGGTGVLKTRSSNSTTSSSAASTSGGGASGGRYGATTSNFSSSSSHTGAGAYTSSTGATGTTNPRAGVVPNLRQHQSSTRSMSPLLHDKIAHQHGISVSSSINFGSSSRILGGSSAGSGSSGIGSSSSGSGSSLAGEAKSRRLPGLTPRTDQPGSYSAFQHQSGSHGLWESSHRATGYNSNHYYERERRRSRHSSRSPYRGRGHGRWHDRGDHGRASLNASRDLRWRGPVRGTFPRMDTSDRRVRERSRERVCHRNHRPLHRHHPYSSSSSNCNNSRHYRTRERPGQRY
ncbi:unnamed protein product [Amoebophrya sp. A120]|nr:unnamed protein product [Amoebophrya sp. A120]|eukprot:GSA120T00007775001.1